MKKTVEIKPKVFLKRKFITLLLGLGLGLGF